jgi:pyruvate/2-oxoglutarate/acetoin dehydrogenase E1 component
VLSSGKDITLVGIAQMAVECLRARHYLQEEGIDAEVIDPVSLSPLDMDTIEQSVLKTKKLIITDNAWMQCGAGSEIISRLAEKDLLQGVKVERMGFAFTPCPTTPSLESHFYPDAKKIAVRAYEMLAAGKGTWTPRTTLHIEEVEFKGPF